MVIGQDDGLPPNFVYLEPIEDFYIGNPIKLSIIITDRNEIKRASKIEINDESSLINACDELINKCDFQYMVVMPCVL